MVEAGRVPAQADWDSPLEQEILEKPPIKPPRVPRGIKGPWVRCAGPGCQNVISADAYPRVTLCGHCQLRARELNWEAGGGTLDREQLVALWETRDRFPVREAAQFLKMPLRTLYNLLTAGRISALKDREGRLCLTRRDMLALHRELKSVVGLREAAELMGVEYSYLRELVRRGVVRAERTFWGHYGLVLDELSAVKATLLAAMPQDNEYSLSSFARLLGVHHSLPQKWIRQGKLRSTKGVTGRVIIDRSEMERFVHLVTSRPAFLPGPVREKILAGIAAIKQEAPVQAVGD